MFGGFAENAYLCPVGSRTPAPQIMEITDKRITNELTAGEYLALCQRICDEVGIPAKFTNGWVMTGTSFSTSSYASQRECRPNQVEMQLDFTTHRAVVTIK